MHSYLFHKRLQHGIGQGGFHSAKVTLWVRRDPDAAENFRFDYVYDCGAVSFGKKSLLMKSIATLCLDSRADSAGKKVLDALVLSHYDQDHMVGAKRLTSLYDVRRIYLPYLSPKELPLILASQAERWRPMQIRALHRVATGGEQLFGVNVSMVGPTSGEEGPVDLPPDQPFPGGNDPVQEPIDRNRGVQPPTSMAAIAGRGQAGPDRVLPPNAEVTLGAPGRPLSEAVWTLRFWNRGVKQDLLDQLSKNLTKCGFPMAALDDAKGAGKIVEWLDDPDHKKKAVEAYRKAINATRPKMSRVVWESRIANHISLGVYSGPANAPRGINASYSLRCWDDTDNGESFWAHPAWWSRPMNPQGSFRTGWLGTGDAPLGEADVWMDFSQRYRQQLDEVLTVQVPHHGAAPKGGPAFFHSGLLPIPGLNAVVSAGVTNAYEHPDESVKYAIKMASGLLHLANELKQPGFEERLELWF
ncbi:MAG: hypothetical protein Q7V16_09530 [Hydrogenophaga sp.]|nr:hypothetical protein [Hydrogenophaga sp.]